MHDSKGIDGCHRERGNGNAEDRFAGDVFHITIIIIVDVEEVEDGSVHVDGAGWYSPVVVVELWMDE